ncbi:MAG: threonylcarbamoyl-AMP synthase [Rhodoferax sp.]|nr:threonylcarbamoyl-AMP synthase [Rhodoferax sp.]
MILPASAPESIALCAQSIRDGDLIGLPTETVYGLAANAEDDAAVGRIFTTKGRPAKHPLIVHVSAQDGGRSGATHFASELPPFAQQLMAAFWPGPLTLILPRRSDTASAAAGGQESVGLRCPAHPVAQALLHALREPPEAQAPVWGLAAPSANRFGRVSPTCAAHVYDEFGPDLPVLDGGACTLGIESTIIDCTRGQPVLLRPGSITRAQIEQVCGTRLLSNEELSTHAGRAPRASGTLESHYAPNAQVRLMDARSLQAALDMLTPAMAAKQAGAADAPAIAVYARSALKIRTSQIVLRTMPEQAGQAAQELFATLRALDATGVKLIWVETPPDTLEWEGVRDRLQRAAA